MPTSTVPKSFYFVFSLVFSLAACSETNQDFTSWYKRNASPKKVSLNGPSSRDIYSSDLLIDKIYRSMEGPYQTQTVKIDGKSEELLWIVGYQSEVLQAESGVALGSSFMCHNNLNYASPEQLPWKLNTTGGNHRIFTLTQGQTKLRFPDGFGIPMPAGQPLEVVSQVLNHNRPELFINTKQHAQILYHQDVGPPDSMKALYQQSVFVTKQLSGDDGGYGMPQKCLPYQLHPDSSSTVEADLDHSLEYDKDEKYNPYEDQYGRKYTGHWVLPNEPETLSTDVSRMLDLEKDSRIHLISVHLHPFAEALELWDKTTDSLLYQASFTKDSLNFGFEQIDYYRSESGIPVYQDHAYELISAYHCTDTTDQHTAMAVMYLYLRE